VISDEVVKKLAFIHDLIRRKPAPSVTPVATPVAAPVANPAPPQSQVQTAS